MSYIAAVAALSGNLPAYDIPIDLQDRNESRPYLPDERVIVIDRREPAIETAYSSQMRNYYDSVWKSHEPAAPIIIIK